MSEHRKDAELVLSGDFDETLFWMCREGDYAGIYAEIARRLGVTPRGQSVAYAARYAWLRARWGRITESYDGESPRMVNIRMEREGEGWDVDPETLDAAIDDAIGRELRYVMTDAGREHLKGREHGD